MSSLQYFAALVFAALLAPSAYPQREVPVGPQRPEAPKTVVFYFSAAQESRFPLERLDGQKIKLLTSDDHGYQSTGIVIEDGHGTCKLENVPPGEYNLQMEVFKLTTTIRIPATSSKAISFDMRIGSNVSITQRTKVDR